MKLSFAFLQTLLGLMLLSYLSNAQSTEIISVYANTPDTCGTGVDILRPEHLIAYQTIDNTQDGEVDSTTCLDWDGGELLLSGADLSRPVFVRLIDFEFEIASNWIYVFSISSSSFENENSGVQYGNQNYCNDGLCNGIEVEIEIPNEEGDGLTTRRWIQEFSFQNVDEALFYSESGGWGIGSDFAICLPTEDFDDQSLADFVLKFNFEEDLDEFSLGELVFDISEDYIPLIESSMSNYVEDNGYEFQYEGNNSSFTILFLFEEEGYPSDLNRSYFDIQAPENPDQQQVIDVKFTEFITFVTQPHTYLRGALVEGQDSLRHGLSIINEGAIFCFTSNADLIIQKGWEFVHTSGLLDFQGGTACLQLNEGAKMIVDDDYLHYGKVGQGMYALYGGSSILLEENAHLYFDGRLLLANHQWDEEFIPVVMTLEEGAKLSFSEFAKLDNLTLDGQTKLLIYNRGGEVDLINLSAEERASIEIVVEAVETKHITLLGNPVQENGMLDFMLFEDGPATIRVIDINGKQVIEQELDSHTPLTHLDLEGLSAGTYLLKVKQQAELRTERFVIN